MARSLRAWLVAHGLVVVMLGLAAGFPYAMVVTGSLAGEERAWRMAHLEGLLNGLLMVAVAAAGGSLRLSAGAQRWLLRSLALAGYGNVVAATLGAGFGVRGLELAGPASNAVVFLLFMAAIVGVVSGVAIALVGALRSARAGGD